MTFITTTTFLLIIWNNFFRTRKICVFFQINSSIIIYVYIYISSLIDITPNQMHQQTLDPVEKVKLTWMVDWPEENVFFQIKNGINEKYSWFAIGFSRRGDFPLTDFCIFQRENDESERIDTNIVSYKSSFLLTSPFYKLHALKDMLFLHYCGFCYCCCYCSFPKPTRDEKYLHSLTTLTIMANYSGENKKKNEPKEKHEIFFFMLYGKLRWDFPFRSRRMIHILFKSESKIKEKYMMKKKNRLLLKLYVSHCSSSNFS